MTISDIIEQMLVEMLAASDGSVQIRRNILADQLNCVPSQINYVIKTRFTPERGYIIESRRGGGGSVTISRVSHSGNLISQIVENIGGALDMRSASAQIKSLFDASLITEREGRIMLAALSDKSISGLSKNEARARLFKNMLLGLLNA